jgi:hypothetical protein
MNSGGFLQLHNKVVVFCISAINAVAFSKKKSLHRMILPRA